MMAKPVSIETIKEDMGKLNAMLKDAEKNEATLTGRLQESLKSIKAEFGVDSIEALEQEKVKEEAAAEKLRSTATKKFQELNEAYQWQ